jgi:hypothetical protein
MLDFECENSLPDPLTTYDWRLTILPDFLMLYDALLPYLLKANAVIAVLFGAYLFLLKNLTFFGLNRVFLLAALLLSLLLPLAPPVPVPGTAGLPAVAGRSPGDPLDRGSYAPFSGPSPGGAAVPAGNASPGHRLFPGRCRRGGCWRACTWPSPGCCWPGWAGSCTGCWAARESGLVMRESGKKIDMGLLPENELEFFSKHEPIVLKFTKDGNGNVTQLLVGGRDPWTKVQE